MSMPISAFLLFIPIILNASFTNGVLIAIETRNLPNLNDVQLHCTDIGGEDLATTNIGLRRTVLVDGTPVTQVFSDFTVDVDGIASLTITPEMEGNFSCVDQDTSTESSNSILVVAFPTIDSSFAIPNINFAAIGSAPTLRCSFVPGIYTEYYSVIWYRGVMMLDTTDGSKYVADVGNLTLTIHDANNEDTSDGYYCMLTVTDPIENNAISSYGYDAALTVYGAVDLYPNTLYDTAVITGIPTILFTCTIESAPIGSIQWLFNGTDIPTDNRYTIQSEQVNSTLTAAMVTSNLTISNPEPQDSGLVQCVGFADNGFETMLESNEATLTVIGNNFMPVLEVTPSGTLLLSFALPGVILEVFTVHIRYTSTVDNQDTFEQVLTDSLFYDTAFVNKHEISGEFLPTSFSSFMAAVAIEVLGVKGAYTDQTGPIDLPTPTPSSSSASSIQDSMSSVSTASTSHQSTSAVSTSTIPYTTRLNPSSTNVAGCMECSCASTAPLVAIIVVLVVVILIAIPLIVVCTCCCVIRSRSLKREEDMSLKDKDLELRGVKTGLANPGYSKDSSFTTSPSHTSASSTTHSHSHTSGSESGDSHSYCSIEDHHSRSTTGTPSRPSSQESYYVDRSRTASPHVASLPRIYENDDEVLSKQVEDKIKGYEQDKRSETHRTTSSIAVGTSPPTDGKEIIIPTFLKGQSESPKRNGDRSNGGILSPARSDPSLESSLKSEYSSSKKSFSQSIVIPSGGRTRDQDTIISPTQNTTLPSYQRFKYGTNQPPVVVKKDPKKDDEKIYQKIMKEYDVV